MNDIGLFSWVYDTNHLSCKCAIGGYSLQHHKHFPVKLETLAVGTVWSLSMGGKFVEIYGSFL